MSEAEKLPGHGWSILPDEIWGLILVRLPLEDFLRCSALNQYFFSIVRSHKPNPTPRIPFLMLPADDHHGHFNLFDPATKRVYPIHLPELQHTTIVASSHGWLILCDENTADLRLFSPFTRASIHLPPTASFPHVVSTKRNTKGFTKYTIQHRVTGVTETITPKKIAGGIFKNALLGTFSSSYVVMVCCKFMFGDLLAFARPGDEKWTLLETPEFEVPHCFTIFEGAGYVMYRNGKIVKHDFLSCVSGLVPYQVVVPGVLSCVSTDNCLVVLQSGELLRIWRNIELDIVVYKFDNEVGVWVRMMNLSGHSLFLAPQYKHAHNALSVKLPQDEMKGNCIYLADGRLEVYDMKAAKNNLSIQYSWKDGRAKPFWISPVLIDLYELGA